MQLFEYKCKNCGANLQLDLDNLHGFCQHCGSAVLIESSMLSQLIMEREKTKQMKMQHSHEEIMFDKKIEAERRSERKKAIIKLIKGENGFWVIWGSLLIFLFLLMLIYGFVQNIGYYELPYSDDEVIGKRYELVKDTFENSGLSNITIVSTTNSRDGSLAEGEVYEVTVSGRNAYKRGEEIAKKKSPKVVIVVYSPDGKFPFPYSDKTAKGQNISAVMMQLEDLGFTNVQEAVREKTLLSFLDDTSSYTILKMTVNGQDSFKIGDRFPLNVPIVLEYYD